MNFFRKHILRHSRFYIAALLGVLTWLLTDGVEPLLRYAIAGDTFFAVYLVAMGVLAFRSTVKDLKSSAKTEDEGIGLIIVLTFAAIGFSLSTIFGLLNQAEERDALHLAFTVGSAPLGWFMLHTVAAFHYAHRYYQNDHGGLEFPGTKTPGIWDFLYYGFVVGATAQVSDVDVTSTPMRKLTLAHGIAAFFYNTVLMALAVNVVVVLAAP
jgi:uncharacterized membrane protein